MVQFERTKETICGLGVVITSWFDYDAQVWRASAPGMVHILHRGGVSALSGSTRPEAIKRLRSLLEHLLRKDETEKAVQTSGQPS
jgi:hypothetical protein